ncbi:MAG: flavin reductase family protein [Alphaproteobacteria bacterium]|nr:flavin reductase family protein [Alphaproteobacteria bacterium]MBE8220879.1 flavin reductase family protein [Alphaproteobacteria bacterium]
MIDDRHLRTAFGNFGTGVAVATALKVSESEGEENSAWGLTINSFASVSLSPPLLSWCLGNYSEMADLFTTATHFGISILSATQKELSMRLAAPDTHCLQDDDYILSENKLPHIAGSLAHFDCQVQQRLSVGDHTLFIGTIENAAYCDKNRAPLFYFRGQYTSSL